MRRGGFSLIELLVVIGIIAILAAILFPMLSRSQENARMTNCAANLHQIFKALVTYADDYDGRMPNAAPINFYPERTSMSGPVDPRQIHAVLRKYCGKSDKVWRCPSDKLQVYNPSNKLYTMSDFAKYGSSYQWRLGLPGQTNGSTYPISGQTMGFYMQPSLLGITRDAVAFHISRRRATSDTWTETGAAGNVLYLDGHTKLTSGTNTLADIM